MSIRIIFGWLRFALFVGFFTIAMASQAAAAIIDAHWDFDQVGGTIATDDSGNGNDATLENSAAMVAGGQLGGALSLSSATTDHAQAIGYSGVTGTTARTVSAWIRTGAAASDMGIVSWGTTGGSGDRYTLRTDPAAGGVGSPAGRLRAEFTNGAIHDNVAAPDLFDGSWHHVAAATPGPSSNNRNNTILYIDGVPVATQTSGSNVTINTDSLTDVFIGIRTLTASTTDIPFDGQIDDTAIFRQELTAAEMRGLYELAVNTELQYDAADANELFTIHENGSGSIEINGVLWESRRTTQPALSLLCQRFTVASLST